MSFFATLSMQQLGTFFKVVEESLVVRSHRDLFDWLHDDVQHFLPHDILIAAWGDFSLGLINLDIISYLPGLRTTEVERQELLPFLRSAFVQWMDSDRLPYAFSLNGSHPRPAQHTLSSDFGKALAHMNTALVQGIKDERGRHDCLYVALSHDSHFNGCASESMELLLPYLDAALRKVVHLPEQYPEPYEPKPDSAMDKNNAAEDHDLSEREVEIMRWVCNGKTNPEIGSILDISAFTVKNHLQRIFRKLDVINRAQAVSKIEKLGISFNG